MSHSRLEVFPTLFTISSEEEGNFISSASHRPMTASNGTIFCECISRTAIRRCIGNETGRQKPISLTSGGGRKAVEAARVLHAEGSCSACSYKAVYEPGPRTSLDPERRCLMSDFDQACS